MGAARKFAPRQPRTLHGGQRGFGSARLKTVDASSIRSSEATSQNEKYEAVKLANTIDESMGFARYDAGKSRVGWLCNMHSTTIQDEKVVGGRAGVDFYFIEDSGETFKATLEYDPYFLLAVRRGREADVEEWCRRAFEGLIKNFKRIEKEDLSMPNHLLGYRRTLIQLSFANVSDLLAVRRAIMPIAEKNKDKMNALDTYAEVASANAGFDIFDEEIDDRSQSLREDASNFIVDIREYDVPYHVRVAIDKDIRVGKWYTVEAKHGTVSMSCIEERLQRADPVVMAFDIETTKLPLKFPDASIDQIMMISYMIDGQGFLITNREIVSEDISDFDYTPKPEYQGPFIIFNEPDERALIEVFFKHIKEARPTVISTYNGDFFDWPFVEARASVLGIDMYQEIGFKKNSEDLYQSDYCAHMDAFAWVNRDSYLPQGSRGLKAVTVAKLGYDPDELDPELMTPYASERPQVLAEYSVSDAVATYYLYLKYVHPFIFSLCTIIPLGPDDVLRKGTGTLCEMLLMVQAYQKGIVLPNKHKPPREEFWDGHLLESETYVGGHVESIEAGVFRSDIPCNFAVDPTAIDELLNDLDDALKFCITVEEKKSLEDVTNYEEVKAQIQQQLESIKVTPNRAERPLIYHLDVASMYPNIMTTNRLQPDSMIQESDCAACDFNRPGKTCDRRMPWSWRGEFLPAKKDEYKMIRHALENERFPGRFPNSPLRTFRDLSTDEQATAVKKRLTDYCKKIYNKIHDSKTIEREAIICQRENPFYVDTVKDFRDRRYDFKGKQKAWKGKTEALKASGASQLEVEEAKKMIILFDSLQLAHKVILNSFYGYVMRKGSRWYSLEMAGVTCLTGAHIIQMARQLVERIGRPLELDTDGIWCILPASFPENFTFSLKNGKKVSISYPCAMLNHLVHGKFTNHQYQELVDPTTFRYDTHSDNTIFFEVDGPYRAMILPTSKEEDKNLKKRYAVFNHDGTLAELKGFEVKRRGELKLVKIFQTQIFKFFLEGTTLQETYESVAKIANRWLDVLFQKGSGLADEELIDLICENKSMSKTLAEYGAQKTTAITTAKRLAEFLGEQMIKDKGLNCKYIIASRPKHAPVTERAIPVAIFSAELHVKKHFLRRWLKEDPGDMDPRNMIDWDYYLERLGSVIQKLITIPAALQKIRNPVPRIPHPDWLEKRIRIKDDVMKQKKMTDMFDKRTLAELDGNMPSKRIVDLEDFGSVKSALKSATKLVNGNQKRKAVDSAPLVADPFASLPSKMPSMSTDYSAWLGYQKKKWKIQKQARLRRRQLFGEKRDAGDAIGSIFRNQVEFLYQSTWQVLQLRTTNTPGELKAFVLIDTKIHTIKVMVPRQIFVNFRNEDLPDIDIPDCSVDKVSHTLPNGHYSVHLFRIVMPEAVYLRESGRLSALSNHPSVEGVYESKVPLDLRAVLQLGNSCTFDESQRGVLGKGLEQGFDLSTLRNVPGKATYLSTRSFRHLFIYHVASGDIQVFAMFSTSGKQGYVVVLNKSRDVQSLSNLDRLYREAYTEQSKAGDGESWQDAMQYEENLVFAVTHATSKRKAHLEVENIIKRIRLENGLSTMVVLQSHQRQSLMHELTFLDSLPVLSLPTDESDRQFPPLGWQSYVARRLVARYLDIGSWLSRLTDLARYGNIPLCNLSSDDPRSMIDIAYARRLQKENVVLWWSEGPRPDHAGYEKDDLVTALDTVEMPSVNTPGTYSTVCIDVEVKNLLINTILTSSLLNDDIDGSDSVSFNPAEDGSDRATDGAAFVLHADNTFTSAGIKIMREMVKTWHAEACSGSAMADVMVQHLVRWIESPASCLYDRNLHHYVQVMAKKAFQQLMADCRRVGSHVIFASQNRLLLQTTKAEVGNAYAYSQYILKTIKAKPLFLFLDLDVKEYWDYLAWYDEFNYGGMGRVEVVAAERQTLDCIMHWQMKDFLPAPLQAVFHDRVVDFITLMHRRKRPLLSTSDAPPRTTQIPTAPPSSSDATTATTPTNILTTALSQPLKKQIIALLRRQRAELLHPALASDHRFPLLPGSHLPLADPLLQLVKQLAQVLSLDRNLALETRLLRRELLGLFDVREFAAAGAFANPSASLVLPQLVCRACALVHDLDLCRDDDLAAAPAASSDPPNPRWSCPACQTPYAPLALQEQLVANVQRAALAWATQDLRCTKCRRLRANDFMEHCSCAGEWVETLDRAELRRSLDVHAAVARYYGWTMVGDVVAGLGL